jgi:ABC-type transport system involved in cytochrome c biogenesis permease component
MTGLDTPSSPPVGSSPFASRAPDWWQRVEAILEKISEYLNPILVKESRQALKSKQFLVTFVLLLIFGWGWSFLGIAWLTPGVYYAPGGPFMLAGYFWILAFPLVVIVPFSAFRSLASEREDGTYELLSITTLRPRQIVAGKLGSAVLQMLVYLSALSPCIAFTYLLRGVDIIVIVMTLVWLFLLSVLLSALGLLLATLTRARHWQVVLSVILILGLAIVYLYLGIGVTFGVVLDNVMPYDTADFWIGSATVATAWACAMALVFLAATARITFVSENRSTALRLAMLVSHLCLFGWCAWFVVHNKLPEIALIYVVLATIFWSAMGAMMIGERTELSPRVRRSLPVSFTGRVFWTWFQPGSGRGYFFAVSNMLVVGLLSVVMGAFGETRPWGALDTEEFLLYVFLSVFYVIAYLGFGRPITQVIVRRTGEGPVVGLLLSLILVALGTVVPLIVQMSLVGVIFEQSDYTVLQISNPFWTLYEVIDGEIIAPGLSIFELQGFGTVPIVLAQAALLALVINLVMSAGDLVPPRSPTPKRVAEEQRILRPERQTTPQRISPWE